MVVLAQTRGAADDFVRSACRAGLLGVHRMTLTGLAVDLAEGPLARAGLTPVGGLSAEAMVARVIHKLKAESIPFGELASHTFPHEISPVRNPNPLNNLAPIRCPRHPPASRSRTTPRAIVKLGNLKRNRRFAKPAEKHTGSAGNWLC